MIFYFNMTQGRGGQNGRGEQSGKWLIWLYGKQMEIPFNVKQIVTASKHFLDQSHRASVVSYGGTAAARKFIVE